VTTLGKTQNKIVRIEEKNDYGMSKEGDTKECEGWEERSYM
jgi:hypothetical protein